MLTNYIGVLSKASEFCQSAASIFRLIGWVIVILQIAIPIIIVIFGIMDLGKAVMAGKEDEIKEAQKMLIKRVIYGVLVFFVVTIVKTVFSLAAPSWNRDNAICWSCVTNPSECPVTEEV